MTDRKGVVMTQTPPQATPSLAAPAARVGVRQLSRGPVLGRPGRGSRSRPHQRDARGVAAPRRRGHARVCRARHQVHDRRPDAYRVRVPLRQPAGAGRNRAAARPGGRLHAAVDHVRGRVRGLAVPRRALRQDTAGDHRRDPGLLAHDRELRPAVLPPRPREGRRRKSHPLCRGVRQRLEDREPRRRSRRPGSCTRST